MFLVKEYIRKKAFLSVVLLLAMIILMGIFMYGLRPYLGFTYAAAFLGFGFMKMNSNFFDYILFTFFIGVL